MTLNALNLTTTAGSQIEEELAALIVDSKEEDEILEREFAGIGQENHSYMLPEVPESEESDFEITRLEKINSQRKRRAMMRDLRTAMD